MTQAIKGAIIKKQILITHLTRMSYPYICIAGIDIESFKNLKMGSCLRGTRSVELRPMLLNNQKWNIDNHGLINLYDTYDLEGSFDSQDNSKEDFNTYSYKISKKTYAIKNLIYDFKKIHQEHKDCCLNIVATNESLFRKPKSVLPFSKLQESLWSYKGRINNINLKGKQWRGDFHIEAWGGELSHIDDLPITDIRFYDVKNNFQPKEKEDIKKIFSFDKFNNINGLISAGLSREFRGRRWLQINTIHPEELFFKENFSCPLCSSEVIDYRKNKPTPNFPEFRCSSENCNQGNGFAWSSWNPKEFN